MKQQVKINIRTQHMKKLKAQKNQNIVERERQRVDDAIKVIFTTKH